MKLTVVGCGDAFGSGGRLQTCYHVEAASTRFLIDCGATTLIGFSKLGIDPNAVETVFISHLHGDHFSGLVWWLVHAQHVAKRITTLTIVGPEGMKARFEAATEALFPGAIAVQRRYELRFLELTREKPLDVGTVRVTPFEVKHPSGAPPYALRFEIEGKVLAFTGDTGWVEVLCEVARGADLFISECFQYDLTLPIHLDYATIDANYARLGAKRLLLTHMGEAMLANVGSVDASRYLLAQDGMILDL
jgi:ribonuclease BN (tRNA processing enzyme)